MTLLYYKNSEVAEKYRVSLGTVRNWIDAAREGKNNLELHQIKDRVYIANSDNNIAIMNHLTSKNKKYRNGRSSKVIQPNSEFYETFSREQAYEIAMYLEMHHEIQRQYNYFNGGAKHWDDFSNKLLEEATPNLIKNSIHLISQNLNYLDGILHEYTRVNVIDIGVGNAVPVKGLLEHLLKSRKLGRYVGIDISGEMLTIAEKNVRKWFGREIAFEGHIRDINYDRFSDLLKSEYIDESDNKTANLILLLGGTHCNLKDSDGAFRIIRDSMSINDFFVHTQKLDTERSREYFDFNVSRSDAEAPPMHRIVLDLLNIKNEHYSLEVGYDEAHQERYERIIMNYSIDLEFDFKPGKRIVALNKGDSITIWHYKQQRAIDVVNQFDRNGFYLLQTSQTNDQEYILTVSKVKK